MRVFRKKDRKIINMQYMMKKNSSYTAPEVFVEQFVCEEGVFGSPYAYFGDGFDDGFDDAEEASMMSYEAFFYGNMNE